ncbi:AAA-like domain protein [Actinomadura rubteroloni]|uniref:AAA-like domain protein n=1 Tax=Actinomadura rubteroloni TaxID=1926885 RepID=A0A2P4UEZ8_9ACTN|nr:type IV secretory system conjugative DNA transfer family protein [Actinomadura rubteroloni]POM23637.1 AAA-like domain protein [Actinomadura rubteroloni]
MNYRESAIFVLAVAGLCAVIVVTAGWMDRRRWRAGLVAYKMRLPADLSVETVTAALYLIGPLSGRWPLVVEVRGTARGITHHILIQAHLAPAMITRLTAAMPGLRLEEDPEGLEYPKFRRARELRSSRRWRTLDYGHGESAIAGVLATMYPLGSDEMVCVQWVVSATRRVKVARGAPDDIAKAVAEKNSFPLLDASGRVAVRASHRSRAALLLAGVLGGLSAVSGPETRIRARALPTRVVARRAARRAMPVTSAWWPMLLSAAEAAALLALPTQGLTVPGLSVGSARQLPPPSRMRRTGLVIADSNYPGMESRPLALTADDRLRHVMIQGPTGSGKSVLLANLILQDIAAGRGVLVIDPKADLIEDITARIPDNRIDDVVVIDAASLDYPTGFNLLSVDTSDEHARELMVDQVVHVFASLWRDSWGPRTADVMRNCLLTLAYTRAPGGRSFTVVEIPALLTDDEFRRDLLRQPIPDAVRGFWTAYDAMSEPERAQVIGPSMNKIRAFSTRTALRLMLGQSNGVDLSTLYREHKIILVPLQKGRIGPDAAHLLGALLVSTLWQITLSRASVPADRRHATFAYLDEFQEFMHFGRADDFAEMLAQARGLGLGVNMAYQYLDQLSADVTNAVLGTVRTQVTFQAEYRDASTLAPRFAPLTRDDLGALDAFEIAMRPCIDARTAAPVTGRTRPLGEPLRDGRDFIRESAQRFGALRADVETEIAERVKPRLRVVPRIGRTSDEKSGEK